MPTEIKTTLKISQLIFYTASTLKCRNVMFYLGQLTYTFCPSKLRKTEKRKSGITQFCAKSSLRMIEQSAIFFAQKCSATKALAFAKIAQKFCEWKP